MEMPIVLLISSWKSLLTIKATHTLIWTVHDVFVYNNPMDNKFGLSWYVRIFTPHFICDSYVQDMRSQHADLHHNSDLRRLARAEERKRMEAEHALSLEEELERMRMEIDHQKAEIQVQFIPSFITVN